MSPQAPAEGRQGRPEAADARASAAGSRSRPTGAPPTSPASPEPCDRATTRSATTFPAPDGDVIHVFKLDRRTGKAARDGVIEVPPPGGTPAAADLPADQHRSRSPGRATSRSRRTARRCSSALNLAHQRGDRRPRRRARSATSRRAATPTAPRSPPTARLGLVSNEADGTVSVIDLAAGEETKEITVGPHLSHPEGIAIDPKRPYAYVAVTHQDLIAVINTDIARGRAHALGRAPAGDRHRAGPRQRHRRRLPAALRELRRGRGRRLRALGEAPLRSRAASRALETGRALADRILDHESRRGIEQSENEAAEARRAVRRGGRGGGRGGGRARTRSTRQVEAAGS